jgi:hypothetical protein
MCRELGGQREQLVLFLAGLRFLVDGLRLELRVLAGARLLDHAAAVHARLVDRVEPPLGAILGMNQFRSEFMIKLY